MAAADLALHRRRFGGAGVSFRIGAIIVKRLSGIGRDQTGASAAEYALILAIVGAAIAVAALGLGNSISNSMNTSSDEIANCGGAC